MTSQTISAEVIKTAVIEDMKDIRDGLATLINFTDGFRCTGSYRSMEEALARIDSEVPDVLLSDIGLPGMSGHPGNSHHQRPLPGNAGADVDRLRRRRPHL
jgi:DNA-binding NarL/FixJ family response regulator